MRGRQGGGGMATKENLRGNPHRTIKILLYVYSPKTDNLYIWRDHSSRYYKYECF